LPNRIENPDIPLNKNPIAKQWETWKTSITGKYIIVPWAFVFLNLLNLSFSAYKSFFGPNVDPKAFPKNRVEKQTIFWRKPSMKPSWGKYSFVPTQ